MLLKGPPPDTLQQPVVLGLLKRALKTERSFLPLRSLPPQPSFKGILEVSVGATVGLPEEPS